MIACPACSRTLPDDAAHCTACGAVVDLSATPTGTFAQKPTPLSIDDSSPYIAHALAPGVIIAGRYRVVNLIGKGGMGEVYRADDLTLNQRGEHPAKGQVPTAPSEILRPLLKKRNAPGRA